MTNQIDFNTITKTEALDALVSLDVARWGEQERAASEESHSWKSRGLLINSIAYHHQNGLGDSFSAAERRAAKAQLTADDRAELRKGG